MSRSPGARGLGDGAARGLAGHAVLLLLLVLRVRADARRAIRRLPR